MMVCVRAWVSARAVWRANVGLRIKSMVRVITSGVRVFVIVRVNVAVGRNGVCDGERVPVCDGERDAVREIDGVSVNVGKRGMLGVRLAGKRVLLAATVAVRVGVRVALKVIVGTVVVPLDAGVAMRWSGFVAL